MKELYILPCSKTKIWDTNSRLEPLQPSGDVYKGQLHLKGKSFVKFYQTSDPAYLILSAKYGFIYPETKIENYNETFKSKKPDLKFLGDQIRKYCLYDTELVIVLGGSVYANVVRRVFKNSKICVPLQFMPIGMMLFALNNPTSVKQKIDDFIWNEFPENGNLATNLVDGCKHVSALPSLEKQESRG